MAYAHSGPDWVEINGGFTLGVGADAMQYPANWAVLATTAQRNAAGIKAIVEPSTTPAAGKVFVGWAAGLANVSNAPTRVAVFADAPRRLIPKSTVQERVDATGKLGTVLTLLNAQPIYFARWFAPDWPNVYFDDVGLLAILGAAGCTEEEIAAITAV